MRSFLRSILELSRIILSDATQSIHRFGSGAFRCGSGKGRCCADGDTVHGKPGVVGIVKPVRDSDFEVVITVEDDQEVGLDPTAGGWAIRTAILLFLPTPLECSWECLTGIPEQ